MTRGQGESSLPKVLLAIEEHISQVSEMPETEICQENGTAAEERHFYFQGNSSN